VTEIPFPFPDPIDTSDSITDVIGAIRKSPELNDEERDVARAIAFKVDLFEVGPCLVGANREAELVGVKAESQPPAFDRVAKDRELAQLLAEIEARKAKEANRNRRLIQIKRFEV
jgi:hypothetical protein